MAANAPSYDVVSPDQRPLIARRLRLIERLILEQGRAYDYRSLTLAQLEALVRGLQPGTPAPAARQAPRVPTAPSVESAEPEAEESETETDENSDAVPPGPGEAFGQLLSNESA